MPIFIAYKMGQQCPTLVTAYNCPPVKECVVCPSIDKYPSLYADAFPNPDGIERRYHRISDFCDRLKVDRQKPWASTIDYSPKGCVDLMMKKPDRISNLVKVKTSADAVLEYCKKEHAEYDGSFTKTGLCYCMNYLFNEARSDYILEKLLKE